MRKYNRKQNSHVQQFGKYLAKRDGGWYCHYCHVTLIRKRDEDAPRRHAKRDKVSIATVDHKKPLTKGGLDEPHNMVLACEDCNHAKGEMEYTEFLNGLPFQD